MDRKVWLCTLALPEQEGEDQINVWATTPERAKLVALGTRPEGWVIVGDPLEQPAE